MASEYRSITLYVPGANEAQAVLRVCTSFESLYNSFVWRPSALNVRGSTPLRVKDSFSLGLASDALSVGSGRSVARTRRRRYSSRRAFTPATSQRLWINDITSGGSFTVNMSGMGEPIDAAAEILDPLRRKARKDAIEQASETHTEDLRHKRVMNTVGERAAHQEMQLKSLELFKEQRETLKGLVDDGIISDEEYKLEIRRLLVAQNNAGKRLEKDDVHVLSISDDESRN